MCLRTGVSDDLARLVTAEIRPGRHRLVTIGNSHTEEADANNSGQDSPYAKPRAKPPALVYYTDTDVNEEAGTPRHKSTTQMSSRSDAMADEPLHAKQQTRSIYSLTVDTSSAQHDDELINTQRDAPPLTRPIKINMLDTAYWYNLYLDHDENSDAHYRYDQSASLRTYLELPELTQARRLEQTRGL